MAHYQNKKIDIIVPWRIGDAILNIPMLIALKQVNEKYNDNNKIRIIAQPFLSELYSPLGIFECKRLTIFTKIISHLKSANFAFFTETININWGYTAKIKYGLTNKHKKIIKFDYELPFMNINNFKDFIPGELISFLQDKFNLGQYSISLFGILLELGYTTEQIIDTFDFSPDSLVLNNFNGFFHSIMKEKYVVFCMEAAYGKKGDANRRWDENYYIEIANKCFEDFNLKSVFVGVNHNFKLPNNPNFIDLRKQLNLFQLAQVIKSSVYYIGNDTAPLHIANIMQKPSVGTYFMEHSLTDFSPIFPELNTKVYCPQNIDEVYDKFKQNFSTKTKL
ncbi:MAG: glycosyltransferase family 9 protein [bacterium]